MGSSACAEGAVDSSPTARKTKAERLEKLKLERILEVEASEEDRGSLEFYGSSVGTFILLRV